LPGEEGQYLAVNSFDNGLFLIMSIPLCFFLLFFSYVSFPLFQYLMAVLRVYDRGSGIIGGGKEAEERPLGSNLKLVASLTGHKNHNWPIKSSFHLGKDCMRLP